MEEFIQIIKDYGAAIISAISVGGVTAIGAVIVKIKGIMDKVKDSTNKIAKQKEETSVELQSVIDQNKQLMDKIGDLTNDVQRLNTEVKNVKGNRKN